ncbi:MAG TPA: glycoside hydrolase family 2 TIM barrel-domain containing protein [Clostridia bacterium]|nr:glycoside hydrolase family 2 TIM barrel-domain containing protein [Clostridia bacterium]
MNTQATIPRSEHPNPQFKRASWLNLNGDWAFEIDNGNSGQERSLQSAKKLSGSILVPFCPESKLSGVEHKDFMSAVWYRRAFEIPAQEADKKVLLHFGAVDYEAFVYINGHLAGTHKGGYSSFYFDITDKLNKGTNVVTVCAKDDTRSLLMPTGKQSESFHSHGCYYTRTTGIWQTVWLEFLPKNHIKSFKLYPDHINGTLQIQAEVVGSGRFKATATFEGTLMGTCEALSNGGLACVCLTLAEKHLWEVGHGRLYDLEISFEEDKVSSYFGLRNIRLQGMKFLINEKPVFQRLVLDQGFYPEGVYTAPTEDDLIKDIELSMVAGFNGARLHEKVFEPLFLYHCDRLGYIVWGEYPNWGLDYSNPEALFSVLPEWVEVINRDFNHPAIIGWCPFNETWDVDGRKQKDELLKIIYSTTKMLDKTRPCIDTSGNYHVITDIYDVHDYNQDPVTFKEHYDALVEKNELYDRVNDRGSRQQYKGEPVFVSEYGGIQWSVDGNIGWGYGNAPKTEQDFIERYKGLTDALLDNKSMLGFCYTQLYDVEQEQNGLYTYDRKPKFDMNIFRKINMRKAAIED